MVCVTVGDQCLLLEALDLSQPLPSSSSQFHFHTRAGDCRRPCALLQLSGAPVAVKPGNELSGFCLACTYDSQDALRDTRGCSVDGCGRYGVRDTQTHSPSVLPRDYPHSPSSVRISPLASVHPRSSCFIRPCQADIALAFMSAPHLLPQPPYEVDASVMMLPFYR